MGGWSRGGVLLEFNPLFLWNCMRREGREEKEQDSGRRTKGEGEKVWDREIEKYATSTNKH